MITVNYLDDRGNVVATISDAPIVPRVNEYVDFEHIPNKLTVTERNREQKVLKVKNKLPNTVEVTIYTVW